MPRGPKGEKRPADVVGNTDRVMRVLTGEIEDSILTPGGEGKDQAAVALGKKGGAARGYRAQGGEEAVGKATRIGLRIFRGCFPEIDVISN